MEVLADTGVMVKLEPSVTAMLPPPGQGTVPATRSPALLLTKAKAPTEAMAELTAAAGPWEPPPEPDVWQAVPNAAQQSSPTADARRTLRDFIHAFPFASL